MMTASKKNNIFSWSESQLGDKSTFFILNKLIQILLVWQLFMELLTFNIYENKLNSD